MNKRKLISYLFWLCFPITLFGQKSLNDTTYILTYDHGGLILWGGEHFIERLKNATEWLDKYPSFKIGLDKISFLRMMGESVSVPVRTVSLCLNLLVTSQIYGKSLMRLIPNERYSIIVLRCI